MKLVATIVWAVLLTAILLTPQSALACGPLSSTEKDAVKAMQEKKPLRLKQDANEHERASWQMWLDRRVGVMKEVRNRLKDAERSHRVARAGGVGEAALARILPKRDGKMKEMLYATGQPLYPDKAIVGENAAFKTKEIKAEYVEKCKFELDKYRIMLDGIQGNYVFDVPTLWHMADSNTGRISSGMIGNVLDVKVTAVLSDTQFVGFANSLEAGWESRLCIFTNFETKDIFTDTVLKDPFCVQNVGVRNVAFEVDGKSETKEMYELKACSFYKILEPVPEKAKTDKAGKGKYVGETAKDAGSEQPQPEESDEPAGEPDKR